MNNSYQILKDKQQKEFNKFPIGAAFNNKQFNEMLEQWSLLPTDTDKILHIGAGCYIRKSDKDAYLNMKRKHIKEMELAIDEDATGDGFIFDMFLYELANHEYCITYELDDTLDALGFTEEEIHEDERLSHRLDKAISQYLKNTNEY